MLPLGYPFQFGFVLVRRSKRRGKWWQSLETRGPFVLSISDPCSQCDFASFWAVSLTANIWKLIRQKSLTSVINVAICHFVNICIYALSSRCDNAVYILHIGCTLQFLCYPGSVFVDLYCEIISLVKVSFLLNYELKYHPNILCNAGKLNARVNWSFSPQYIDPSSPSVPILNWHITWNRRPWLVENGPLPLAQS